MEISQEVLKDYRLFQGLTDEEVNSLTEIFSVKQVKEKEIFIKANEVSHAIFLIVKGVVSVEVPRVDEGSEELAKLKAGQCVGEFVLAKEARRSANVRAMDDITLYETTREKLIALCEKQPRLGYVVYRNLSEIVVDRIRDTNILARNALSLASQQF